MTTGYSGTPLARKLGFRPGMRVWIDAMPETVRAEIAAECPDLVEIADPASGFEAAHVFVTQRNALEHCIAVVLANMDRNGFAWISWPKKAARMDTDITEDTIRDVALPNGLVDIKVCAVDAVWSGLKLVIRKDLR